MLPISAKPLAPLHRWSSLLGYGTVEGATGEVMPAMRADRTVSGIEATTAVLSTISSGEAVLNVIRMSDGRRLSRTYYQQLEPEPLINLDGSYAGTAWGRVHHTLDLCRPTPVDTPHLHVIWQKGTELRRCRVEMPSTPSRFKGDDAPHWNWLSVLLYCDLDLPFGRPIHPVDMLPVTFEQGVVEVKVHPEHRTLLWPELHTRDERRQAREVIEAEYSARPIPEELVEINDHDRKLDGWIPEINNQIRQEKRRRAAERTRYEELTVLPQIFIGT